MPTMSSLCETCGKRRGASGSTRCTCNDAPPGYFSRFISRVFSREAGCETIHAGTAMAGAWPEEQITQDHLEGSTTVSSTLESDQELKQTTSQPPADLATAESTVASDQESFHTPGGSEYGETTESIEAITGEEVVEETPAERAAVARTLALIVAAENFVAAPSFLEPASVEDEELPKAQEAESKPEANSNGSEVASDDSALDEKERPSEPASEIPRNDEVPSEEEIFARFHALMAKTRPPWEPMPLPSDARLQAERVVRYYGNGQWKKKYPAKPEKKQSPPVAAPGLLDDSNYPTIDGKPAVAAPAVPEWNRVASNYQKTSSTEEFDEQHERSVLVLRRNPPQTNDCARQS